MEQYAQMKSSGVSWIQDVPSEWGIRVLFQLVDQVKNKNKDLAEQNLLSLSYGKIKRKDINNPEGLLPESFDGYNIIEADDIVLRLTDLQNDHTSLRVGQANERGIITSAYTTLRPSSIVNPRYLYYVMHAYDLIKGFYGMGAGVRQGLTYDEVKTIKVPFPSQHEQDVIAAFLDTQVDQIDTLIEESKENIDDLKKWRTSIIYESVTKGIDYPVRMKESVIEGIDYIPEHWFAESIKSVSTYNDEVLVESTDPEYEFDYIDIGSVKYGDGVTAVQRMSFKDAPSRARRVVKNGDVIISSVRTYLKAVALIEESEIQQIASTGFVVLRATRIDPLYLYYAVLSDRFISTVEANSTGMSYPAINASKLVSFKIPVPPKDEQERISCFLNDKCKMIEALIKEKEKLISDLELYKRSMIYETVTGKRKVV